MEAITVWTKQHKNVLAVLEQDGMYFARRDYIQLDLEEHANLVLEVYDWLVKHTPHAAQKPPDAQYPVWVSYAKEATMMPSEQSVILELSLDPALVTPINIEKWGTILNYSYIPESPQDALRHRALLEQYGVSDAKAFMTQFYPQIKREIINSWSRLFDDNIILGNHASYGNIWGIKKEWITAIIT